MDKKVVLFTANVQGGILQLTLQLYKTLKEEKFNVCVVMPCEIQDINIGNIAKADLIQYHKQGRCVRHGQSALIKLCLQNTFVGSLVN